MFLMRSLFWLTVAFLVIRPGAEADMGAAASDLSARAMAAGQQMIAEQVASGMCGGPDCAIGKAVVAAALSAKPVPAIEAMPAAGPVPLPRPRPDRAG